ncbi:hybrid sensor histidine kinase/response regulator transcription factor [Sphingobacterium suaedae]|uniref:histidine kinase n=1 Tax=Sphingobacterium suaedae TaxID=1686402 RepID=A0ABW5KIG2_9SPHI
MKDVLANNLILFLLLLCSVPGNAQRLSLSSVGIEQELPSLTINKTYQDQEGYIWLATTEGICRYDGYGIRTIRLTAPSGDATLVQNITTISEVNGHLLVGADAGLYIIFKDTYKAIPFPDQRLAHEKITDILVDKRRRIWVGTAQGMHVYGSDFRYLTSYGSETDRNSGLPHAGVNSFFEDLDGSIWICFWEAGLYKLNPTNERAVAYPPLGNRNNPYRMMRDRRGHYWVCTWGDGLFMFDDHRPSAYTTISVKNKRRKTGDEYLFYDIIEDAQLGYIWVLSFSGISAFHYSDAHTVNEIDLSPTFDRTANIFAHLFQGRDGTRWLSIPGEGITHIRTDRPETHQYTLHSIKEDYSITPNLTTLFRDSDGEFWFNQERIGLMAFNPVSGDIRSFSNTDFKDVLSLRAVNGIVEMNGDLWIGSAHEPIVHVFRKDHKKLHLRHSFDLRHAAEQIGFPTVFVVDNRQTIWVGTTRGLAKKGLSDNQFKNVAAITDHVMDMTTDREGNVWVATKNQGLYHIPPGANVPTLQLNKTVQGLQTNQIESVATDMQGKLWIGTKDKRLLAYHPATRLFTEYANALVFSNERLIDIAILPHNIWLSTTRHLYKLDPQTGALVEYSQADGFQVNMFNKKSHDVDRSQQLVYFAGHNGLVGFKDTPIQHVPESRAFIADIRINNRSVIQNFRDGQCNFRDLHLVLRPNEQNIEINFTSMAYAAPEKIRYAYKLEGVDKEWVYAPRERVFATYNNLSKGTYTFLLKATDLNNKWSSPITELHIVKQPAFYESTLAYVLYVLLLAGLIYYIVSFTLNRLKLRSDLQIAQIEKTKTDELVQTKLGYFTNISHDLLTPLTIISCLLDDIQITTKKNLSQFEKMRYNLDRLKRLLQQILDFRRVENKQMQLLVSADSIDSFVEELGNVYFGPLAQKKKIDFQMVPPDRPIYGYFDRDKLDKIVFNILSNAFKYTAAGGQVTLRYGVHEENGIRYLHMEIHDTGVGIPATEIDRIFIPFYTNKDANHRESNGIGLALTKELVEIHHGRIHVHSIAQRGSCFTIQLPIDGEAYSDSERQDVHEQFGSSLVAPPVIYEQENVDAPLSDMEKQQLHLLLVEDNEDLRHTIANVLSRNYQVHQATQGEEALDILRHQDIDIVISDIMMPVMDGLTLCKTIKNADDINHIPVILLTAKNSMDDRVECYQAGADGYISKPFELKVLEARIHSFVINKRTKQLDFKTDRHINISTLDHTPLDEQFLTKMIHIIEEHLSDSQFDVVVLGDKVGLSKSTLYRKTKVLLNLSPSEFIKNIRLKHACQMMEKDKSITVSEVAFSTGFSDPRYFSTCFKAEFGITPSEYQKSKSGHAIGHD